MAERDPLDAVDETTEQYKRAADAYAEARRASIAAVVAALKAGKRPTDVADRSPFTATYVRRVAREHGIEPRRKGGPS